MSRVFALLLAVLTIVQACVASGLVVACTSANGDVELEWALGVCCDVADGHGDSDGASGSAHDAGCSCHDELLAAADAQANSNADHSIVVAVPVLTPFVEPLAEDSAPRSGEVCPESSGPPQPRRPILVLRC